MIEVSDSTRHLRCYNPDRCRHRRTADGIAWRMRGGLALDRLDPGPTQAGTRRTASPTWTPWAPAGLDATRHAASETHPSATGGPSDAVRSRRSRACRDAAAATGMLARRRPRRRPRSWSTTRHQVGIRVDIRHLGRVQHRGHLRGTSVLCEHDYTLAYAPTRAGLSTRSGRGGYKHFDRRSATPVPRGWAPAADGAVQRPSDQAAMAIWVSTGDLRATAQLVVRTLDGRRHRHGQAATANGPSQRSSYTGDSAPVITLVVRHHGYETRSQPPRTTVRSRR